MLTAIVGINWGDEGKGRMVDLLSEDQDVVVRYQGGNNAGHTVVNEKGKFILNLLPSGILRGNVLNIMGNGMAIDLEHLNHEIENLRTQGIEITPENLKISDKAVICMPYHVELDKLEEERLKERKYGSTKRGIAPVYADKYRKKAIRTGDLFDEVYLEERVKDVIEYENLLIEKGYDGNAVNFDTVLLWLKQYGDPIKPFIADIGEVIYEAASIGKNIMFEAQLGALRDIDFGIYPYTTSSSTLSAYAPIGSGIPGMKIDKTIGIVKAYSSCVGEGPFVSELFNEEGSMLREAGSEYGAATGRPRRVGAFDVPATKYGCIVQGADVIAVTKLDVMSYMKTIPVCLSYNIEGVITEKFPVGERLNKAIPVIKYLKGWNKDISKCRAFEELPSEAKDYINFIEESVGVKISYVSVGAERDAYIMK